MGAFFLIVSCDVGSDKGFFAFRAEGEHKGRVSLLLLMAFEMGLSKLENFTKKFKQKRSNKYFVLEDR